MGTLLVIHESVGFLIAFEEGSEWRMASGIRWFMASASSMESSESGIGLMLGARGEPSRDWERGKARARSIRVSEGRTESLGDDSKSSRQAGQTKAPGPGIPGASRVERHFAHTGCCWEG